MYFLTLLGSSDYYCSMFNFYSAQLMLMLVALNHSFSVHMCCFTFLTVALDFCLGKVFIHLIQLLLDMIFLFLNLPSKVCLE